MRRGGRSRKLTVLVFLIFIAISLLTNIFGPIIPDIISGFSLSLTAAALLPFSFFLAYGVMSIPAGILVERFGEKPVILLAFALSFAGALLVAWLPGYHTALVSVFLIGVAMNDQHVGQLVFLRVYSGTLNASSGVLNSTKDKKERVGRLLRMPVRAAGSACA